MRFSTPLTQPNKWNSSCNFSHAADGGNEDIVAGKANVYFHDSPTNMTYGTEDENIEIYGLSSTHGQDDLHYGGIFQDQDKDKVFVWALIHSRIMTSTNSIACKPC